MPLYGCCIPLAGEGCARDDARRRVSERNRRKAALSAEITQEGIHRRLRPKQRILRIRCFGTFLETSSLDPPPAALRLFPCAIEILSFQNFYKVLKTCSARRKDFFDTLRRRALPVSLFVRQGPRSASRAVRAHSTLTPLPICPIVMMGESQISRLSGKVHTPV